ncbi:hypothetical protein PSTT_16104 [Puccinia striiformis]|uniref:C2H2-type domain-containing protein n=1 Tax=Puccinia striiformis TaxID=27350 RepID=A0A2S4UEG0_9BASI|nr:hypothetical protein PSTT_16104 [Puccinia striiformis]
MTIPPEKDQLCNGSFFPVSSSTSTLFVASASREPLPRKSEQRRVEGEKIRSRLNSPPPQSAMSSDEIASNSIHPHKSFVDKQSRQSLEVPPEVEHLHLSRRVQRYPSQINLGDIPMHDAAVSEWLDTIARDAFLPRSYWSSDSVPSSHPSSDPSSDSASTSPKVAEPDVQSLYQPPESDRHGLRSSESRGHSPQSPGYGASNIRPSTGASTSRALSSSPIKKIPSSPVKKVMRTSPKAKNVGRLQGKKKHRRIAVVRPLSKLRQYKPTARKAKALQRRVLISCSTSDRPSQQPIFRCPICSLQLPLLSAIKHHIRSDHPNYYNQHFDHRLGPETSSSEG